MKLISVIIPVYNTEKYLDQCIKSVLCQTYENIEIILVDDESTDRSGEICDNYKRTSRKIKVIHKTNGGLSSARNAGIAAADGEYIGFVDSDDYIAPEMYEKLIWHCENTNTLISQINYMRVFEPAQTGGRHGDGSVKLVIKDEFFRSLLLQTGDCSCCTKLFHKHCFDKCKFKEGVLNEDFEILIRMIRENVLQDIAVVNYLGYFYFFRDGSITNSGFSKTVVDIVDHSDIAYKFTSENYPAYIREAERYYVVQRIIFLNRITLDLMHHDNIKYMMVVQSLKKMALKIMINPYLSFREKRNSFFYGFCPVYMKKLLDIKHKKYDKKAEGI